MIIETTISKEQLREALAKYLGMKKVYWTSAEPVFNNAVVVRGNQVINKSTKK